MDYAHGLATGTVGWAPWPFLRLILRRRAADYLDKRRLTPCPCEQRCAFVLDDAGLRDYNADHFSRPGEDPERDLISHRDGPRIERTLKLIATPRQREAVRAWQNTDSRVEAAKVLRVPPQKTVHKLVTSAIRRTRAL